MTPERLTRGLEKGLRRLAPLRFKKIDPVRLVDLGCLVSLPLGYFPTNPSIVQAFDMLIFCVRGVNYKLNNIGPLAYQFTIGSVFHSKNRVAILDLSFEYATPLNHLSIAFENVDDMKLFTDQGKLCAIGSRLRSDRTAEMVIYTISQKFDVESIQTISSPFNAASEKNWLPFAMADRLYIVYSLSPPVILRMNRARTAVELTNTSAKVGDLQFLISGSTPGLQLDGEYLFVAHRRSVRLPSMRRVYLSRLYVLETSTGKVRGGPWFSIGEPTIQFLNGMVLREKEALISFGEMDKRAWLAVFDREHFLNELYPRK